MPCVSESEAGSAVARSDGLRVQARTPLQKKVLRGADLPHQVHYYSNVGDRLPVLGDEERETRQTFQELVQLGHTCVVMLR